jgi:membrane protein implicated in regulation of membrane protease activity
MKSTFKDATNMPHLILTVLSRWFSPVESQVKAQKAAIGSICENIDKLGTVAEIIQPGKRGRVSFQATTWFAVCPYDVVLMPNTRVRVIEHHDSTLIVEPVAFGSNPALPSVQGA